MSTGDRVSRRRFLQTVGGAGALAFSASAQDASAALPPPADSGIEHVILVMMENRSFDHFFGWLPGADGRQAGLTYTDKVGAEHSTYPLAPDYQGCGHPDPDHSYIGGRVEYNFGACDGWLRAGDNDVFAIGYYTEPDLPFLGPAAQEWTVCDRYFAAIMGPTVPNRIYQYSGVTDRLDDSLTVSHLPTIFDRLATAGLTGRYYFSDVPFAALWGLKYLPISKPFTQFVADCAAGALPHVSYVDPRMLGEERGFSNDDHPHADIRNGEVFLNQVYTAVTTGPAWSKTLLVINFDEWGGFFDHVPPTKALDINPALALRGFRVPCLVISPWSRRGFVAHPVLDHTSVLRLIEWRWGLKPLSVRDATAVNLARVLDFNHPNPTAPPFQVGPGPYGSPCPVSTSVAPISQDAEKLLLLACKTGWPI